MLIKSVRLVPDMFFVREYDSSVWDLLKESDINPKKDYADTRAVAEVEGHGYYRVSTADSYTLQESFKRFYVEFREYRALAVYELA